jgi:putative nucleotidyltransferase with HDIG domain
MNAPTLKVEAELVKRLTSARAALPVLPLAASAALEMANDPEADLGVLERFVARDPPIAARLVALANSPLYRRGTPVTSIRVAVMRLGVLGTRDLLLQSVYAAQMVQPGRHQGEISALFSRSMLCGLASAAICRVLHEANDYAYLAGLVHDIGEARIFRVLGELPAVEGTDVCALLTRHHTDAGAALARAWRLPESVVQVCDRHHDETDGLPRAVEVVRAADVLVASLNATEHPVSPSLERIGLTPEAIEALRLEIRTAAGQVAA